MERRKVSLEEARINLQNVAKINVKNLHSPDRVSEACERLYSFSWSTTPSREIYEDREIDKIIGLSKSFDICDQEIWIVSDIAFAGEGVLVLSPKSIANYISQYKDLVGSNFFDGDVIAWSMDQIWLIHHENVYSRIGIHSLNGI